MPARIEQQDLFLQLARRINELIEQDFEELVRLFYRIDVSEPKLKQMLKENPGKDAGEMIALLIIERQLQKLKSREQFKKPGNKISDEDKW